MFIGWLIGWLASLLALLTQKAWPPNLLNRLFAWLLALLCFGLTMRSSCLTRHALLAHILARFALVCVSLLALTAWLRCNCLLDLLACVLRWIAQDSLWTLLKYNFLTETAILVWCFGSWAWFFWRPLQEGNFEIFLETLQLHRIPNPIWFCNCKLRYTIWEI